MDGIAIREVIAFKLWVGTMQIRTEEVEFYTSGHLLKSQEDGMAFILLAYSLTSFEHNLCK